MTYLLFLSADASKLREALSSRIAIIVYAVLLIALLIFLIISAMSFEIKRGKNSDGPTVINISSADTTVGASSAAQEESGDRVRFEKLTGLDANKDEIGHKEYDEGITLKSLCEGFRNFCSYRLKLYYDIEDIRRFIAGMTVSNLIILQGMSGTGKTSLAYAFGTYIDNRAVVVPVQPMWKERTDLIGYYNEFTKQYNETTLLTAMYEANYSKDMYVTILDEMNIARVEYYFAEFLSLLELPEKEKRTLDVVSAQWENDPKQLEKGKIVLPSNMWFIGTANNDDSTFAISDKVYDRAMILNLDTKAEPFIAPYTKSIRISAEKFIKLAQSAREEYAITRRNINRLEELDRYMIEGFHITFGNRIMKQINEYIPVYVACGGEELEALDDILSKKVLRKLEMQSPTYIRAHKDEFFSVLDRLFGENEMKHCRQTVKRIAENA